MRVIGKAVPQNGYWVGGRHWLHAELTTAELSDAEYAQLKTDPHLVLVPIPDSMLCANCGAKLGKEKAPEKAPEKSPAADKEKAK